MNNETSNPMPESAAASPEAEPVKKTRKPRAAKADGAKDTVEAKKPAAPRKRAGVKKDAAAEAKPARKRVTKPRAEEPVAVEEPVQPVAEQDVEVQSQGNDHDAADAVVAEVAAGSVAAPHGHKGRKGQNIDFADVISATSMTTKRTAAPCLPSACLHPSSILPSCTRCWPRPAWVRAWRWSN